VLIGAGRHGVTVQDVMCALDIRYESAYLRLSRAVEAGMAVRSEGRHTDRGMSGRRSAYVFYASRFAPSGGGSS